MSRTDNFEEAFRANHSGCRGICECGQVYYNGDNSWDWEDGEYEALEKSDAICSQYSIGYVELEGREYVDVCPCRNERVENILDFIDSHGRQIARYLNLESAQAMHKAKELMVNDKD